jgi:hypothetical protein
MLSVFTIVANDRHIIVDKIIIDWGLAGSWELAYFTYIIFTAIAIFYGMMHESASKFNMYDWVDITTVIVFIALGTVILGTIAFGTLATAVNNMLTESSDWAIFYTGLLAVYVTNKFIRKR